MGSKIVKFFSTRLQRKLMSLFMFIVITIMAVAGGFWTTTQTGIATTELYNKADRTSLLLKRTLSTPLWNLNLGLMTEQLDAVMADREVLSIAIYERGTREPLLSKQREGAQLDEAAIERTSEIIYESAGEIISLGQVEIVYTQQYLQDNLQRQQWAIAGIILLLAAALLTSTYFVINQTIEQPMKKIMLMLERVTAGDLDQTVDIQRDDEIGILAQSLNLMTARLSRSYLELEQRVQARTRELERHSNYLEAAAQVSRATTSILDIEQLAHQVVELIRQHFGLYHVALFTVDPTRSWAEFRAGTGQVSKLLREQQLRLEVGGVSMIGWCTSNGQPRVAQDARTEPNRMDHPLLPDTRSEAALPLVARGRVIGALSTQSSQVGTFDPDTVAVLQTLADQVAVALDNARLFTESQAALEAEQRAYGKIARQAWDNLLAVRSLAGYSYAQKQLAPITEAPPPQLLAALRQGHNTLTENSMAESQAGPVLAVPIKVRGQVIGVVDAQKSAGDEPWSPEGIALLETLVDQLGQALESARLYENTQRRAAQEKLIGEVTNRMRESLDIERVLQTAAREFGQAASAVQVNIRLLPEDKSRG